MFVHHCKVKAKQSFYRVSMILSLYLLFVKTINPVVNKEMDVVNAEMDVDESKTIGDDLEILLVPLTTKLNQRNLQ